jgi:hypothetical protein
LDRATPVLKDYAAVLQGIFEWTSSIISSVLELCGARPSISGVFTETCRA